MLAEQAFDHIMRPPPHHVRGRGAAAPRQETVTKIQIGIKLQAHRPGTRINGLLCHIFNRGLAGHKGRGLWTGGHDHVKREATVLFESLVRGSGDGAHPRLDRLNFSRSSRMPGTRAPASPGPSPLAENQPRSGLKWPDCPIPGIAYCFEQLNIE